MFFLYNLFESGPNEAHDGFWILIPCDIKGQGFGSKQLLGPQNHATLASSNEYGPVTTK